MRRSRARTLHARVSPTGSKSASVARSIPCPYFTSRDTHSSTSSSSTQTSQSTPDYFQWALRLARPGTLIVVDNVVRKGALVDAGSNDPNVLGMRRLIEMIAAEPKVTSTLIQTVGSKGYDGFVMALVSPGP